MLPKLASLSSYTPSLLLGTTAATPIALHVVTLSGVCSYWQPLSKQIGDSQETQVIDIPRCFGSLSEHAMALSSTICPHRFLSELLSTLPIAQALPHWHCTLSNSITHGLFAKTLCHSSGCCPCSSSQRAVHIYYVKVRDVPLLLMANGPQLSHQTERSLSRAYCHI